jgi:hypothetical protein
MGWEADCEVRWAGVTARGKLQLEGSDLRFVGPPRMQFALPELTAARVEDGALVLDFAAGRAHFVLGAESVRWLERILHPPTRLQKLGVKPHSRVCCYGQFDADFLAEIEGQTGKIAEADFVFLAAESKPDLGEVKKVARFLRPRAALWIVYPKGVTVIRQDDVFVAGRNAGLVDTKVASFSDRLTALKFVAPAAPRDAAPRIARKTARRPTPKKRP